MGRKGRGGVRRGRGSEKDGNEKGEGRGWPLASWESSEEEWEKVREGQGREGEMEKDGEGKGEGKGWPLALQLLDLPVKGCSHCSGAGTHRNGVPAVIGLPRRNTTLLHAAFPQTFAFRDSSSCIGCK